MSKKTHHKRGKRYYSAPDDKKGANPYRLNIHATLVSETSKCPTWRDSTYISAADRVAAWKSNKVYQSMTAAKAKHLKKLCKYSTRSFYGYTHCPF